MMAGSGVGGGMSNKLDFLNANGTTLSGSGFSDKTELLKRLCKIQSF
jgi:hypothetical protein